MAVLFFVELIVFSPCNCQRPPEQALMNEFRRTSNEFRWGQNILWMDSIET